MNVYYSQNTVETEINLNGKIGDSKSLEILIQVNDSLNESAKQKNINIHLNNKYENVERRNKTSIKPLN